MGNLSDGARIKKKSHHKSCSEDKAHAIRVLLFRSVAILSHHGSQFFAYFAK